MYQEQGSCHSKNDEFCRLGRPPSTLDLLFQIRKTIEDNVIGRLHRMYHYLDVPRGPTGWGTTLKGEIYLFLHRNTTM